MYKYLVVSFILIFFTLTGCENSKENIKKQNAIKKVENGYILTIPSQIADKINEEQSVILTLQNVKNGNSSAQGHLKRTDGGLLLETRETLDIPLNRSNFGIVLHKSNTPAASCGPAEFDIGCFFAAPCVGTEYCLPGHGSGGFTCNCL